MSAESFSCILRAVFLSFWVRQILGHTFEDNIVLTKTLGHYATATSTSDFSVNAFEIKDSRNCSDVDDK